MSTPVDAAQGDAMPTRKSRALTTNPGGSAKRNDRTSEKGDRQREYKRTDSGKSAKGPGKPVPARTLVEKDRTQPRQRGNREDLRASRPKSTVARRPSTEKAGARPITQARSGERTGTRTVKGADAKGGPGKAGGKKKSARR